MIFGGRGTTGTEKAWLIVSWAVTPNSFFHSASRSKRLALELPAQVWLPWARNWTLAGTTGTGSPATSTGMLGPKLQTLFSHAKKSFFLMRCASQLLRCLLWNAYGSNLSNLCHPPRSTRPQVIKLELSDNRVRGPLPSALGSAFLRSHSGHSLTPPDHGVLAIFCDCKFLASEGALTSLITLDLSSTEPEYHMRLGQKSHH